MIVLRELAYAKINLCLHVTGKRADNYHLLDSLVGFADVGDKLEVVPAESVSLAIKGPYASEVPENDNSVLKAIDALKRHYKVTAGAGLTLHKNLPTGAGMGSASADAAATLRLLTRFWKLKPVPQELHKMALALGADAPACLRGGSLYVGGIGEALEVGPPLSGLHIVIASCGKPLLTRNVFAAYKSAFSSAPRHPHAFESREALIQFLQKTKNDLQPVAVKLLPEITTVLEALTVIKECQLARMTGSGSACFGVFADHSSAQDAAQQITEHNPTWWVKAATLQ